MTVRYEAAIDCTAVDAIDFHTHVEVDASGHCAYDDELAEATGRYFKLGADYFTRVDDLAAHYRQHNTAAVVFTIDAHTVSGGRRPNSVEELIEGGTVRNNDVLIPFGSVDPWDSDAVRRVQELTGDYGGVKGFKFHPPSLQASNPTIAGSIRSTSRSPPRACPRCFTPARPDWGRRCPAGTESSCATPTRCCSTMSPPTSLISRS